jgi:hypothetical protein
MFKEHFDSPTHGSSIPRKVLDSLRLRKTISSANPEIVSQVLKYLTVRTNYTLLPWTIIPEQSVTR